MLSTLQKTGQAGYELLRRALARGFASSLNPLQHLGALTIFFLWVVLVSGLWLFVFFRTSVDGAYESVEYLTHTQWYLGGVMRSLHRYASDAAVITILLHIGKEFSYDRYRGKRWFSWITGVPLIWIVIPLGITGYWLVWDQLAQYVALTSAELIDRLPVFTDAMARNFLSDESLSNRFFTLMAFLHFIGLPLFLVFGIWLHVFRISRPRINPPRALMVGTLLAMLVLSFVYPALSQGKADLAQVPTSLGLDWFYLSAYPLAQLWPLGWVWVLLVGTSLLLCLAPWLPPAAPLPTAVVDLDNCNGCQRCADDCPFDAITMAPRSDGKAYEQEAVVDPDLCVSCGICVGSCPTAMPFRTRSALIPGIDLPDLSAADLRTAVNQQAAEPTGQSRVLVIGCQGQLATRQFASVHGNVTQARCMAHVPPPYVDYILSRNLADGVLLAGCADGDCQYRYGIRWTEQRMLRERDPQLRKRVDSRRVAMAWRKPWSEYARPADMLAAFEASLADLGGEEAPVKEAPVKKLPSRRKPRLYATIAAYSLFSIPVAVLSTSPRYTLLNPGEAIVSLTFSRAGQRLSECRKLTQEELAALPPNMRNPSDCPRERRPVEVEFRIDGDVSYQASLPPSGIWNDGESTVYKRLTVSAGEHRFFVGMRDSGSSEGFDYEHEQELVLKASQHVVVEFDALNSSFIFR